MYFKFLMKKSGQGSVEFIIMFGAVLLFFTMFFLVIQKNIEQKTLEKETILAQNVALSVQNEINVASLASEGYSRDFIIDQEIMGKDYNITIADNIISVSTDRVGLAYSIVKVVGTIKKGINTIKKQNGQVFLN